MTDSSEKHPETLDETLAMMKSIGMSEKNRAILLEVSGLLGKISNISRLLGKSQFSELDKTTKYPRGVKHFQDKAKDIVIECGKIILDIVQDLIDLSVKNYDRQKEGDDI